MRHQRDRDEIQALPTYQYFIPNRKSGMVTPGGNTILHGLKYFFVAKL
jgi:hypothetical protein